MDKEIKTLPVIALRGMTVLPGMLIHFDISRDITLAAVNEAMEGDRYVFVTSQKDADIEKPSYYDLFEVGVIAKIKQIVKLQDNLMRIMISSRQRATLISMPQTKPFLIGDVIPYEPDVEELRREADEMKEAEREAALRSIKEMYALYIVENPKAGKSIYDKIQRERDLGTLLDLVGMNLPIPMERRQDLLECFSVPKRFRELSKLLANEIEISKIREEYREKVKDEVDKNLTYKLFNENEFYNDLASAKAVICNGGFTFISEAISLKKPIYSVPAIGNFEQTLNGFYVQKLGYGEYLSLIHI